MKKTHIELLTNLQQLGLVNWDNSPVSFTIFKNRATIMRYGDVNRGVFVGQPDKNLFGFYTFADNDVNVMKEAYQMFVKLVKGNMIGYHRDEVQWGNSGVPKGYSKLTTV